MATRTFDGPIARRDPALLLRRTLQLDAIISLVSGAGLLAAAGPVAQFLGLAISWPIALIGADLLLYAAWLAYEGWRPALRLAPARVFLALDIAWVLGSALILALNPWGLTPAGWWAVAVVADLVVPLALGKYLGLRRLNGR